MILNYFKIALRYLAKNKIYSFINVAGLSLALACVMLMVLYTKDELSFDRFHEDINTIYRIGIEVRNPDGSPMDKIGATSIFQGPVFKANLPEVESFVRITKEYKDIKLATEVQSQMVVQADTNFFSFFTFPLLQGNAKTALSEPNSVVITEDVAIRYFGSTDALDRTILFEHEGTFNPYKVTGVAKRILQNSSIQFEMMTPLIIAPEQEQSAYNWMDLPLATFIKLPEGVDVGKVTMKMQTIFERDAKDAIAQVRSMGFDQSFFHHLQLFTELHLWEELDNEFSNSSKPIYSYILSAIALFILVIACINFINLTIARSIKRAKEIGIRKIVGGARKQLIYQFLGESFLLCCFAFATALLLTQLLLPLFNSLINKQLSLAYLLDAKLIIGYVLLLIITGFIAGFYPAIVLSGYRPVQTLYNQFRLSGKNYVQRGLIVFQFCLATVLIIATFTVYYQFDYLTKKDLGYDPEGIVRVTKRNLTPQEAKLFGEQLMKNPNIVSVGPFRHEANNAKITGDSIRNFNYEAVDENFVDILKLQIVEGRNFSSQFPSDSSKAVLVNEAFVKMAGLKDPIGHEINFFLTSEKKVIVGIVKDYHFTTLRSAIAPQCFGAIPKGWKPYKQMLVRIKPNSEASAMPYIEKTFKKLFPVIPYSYQFDSQTNLQNYEAESKWKKMILTSAFLTIFIAAMGLFGLSILTAEQRFKEIGIRKVLGATVNAIVVLLCKDLLVLISLALLLAIPLAYYASNLWLETY
ncbi:MAG TPA: ABC transporter permease, partial [Cyclobacteriaceae bacterium]